ncbi:hypothetical protein [Odoribacter laneus]|uniref:hypothetical protein n=1 Tax=Odoribacter laneus TaxID=626933 RepID=UPI003AF87DF2
MMKRVVIRVGNVFCADIKGKFKRYFQYIGLDYEELNSQVIRVFKTHYPVDAAVDLKEVVKDEVDFHVHVVIRAGFHYNYWEKVGNVPFKEKADALFRATDDFARGPWDPLVKVSSRWYVWRMNEPMVFVGRLNEETRKADIGLVWDPGSVFKRMETGYFPGPLIE